MSRGRTQGKSALTSAPVKPGLERQARRLARQAKQLDKEFSAEYQPAVQLTGAKTRALKYSDIKHIDPLTDMQGQFFNAYQDGAQAMMLYGSAGTGKTWISMHHALSELFEPESLYDKIIIIRSSAQSRDQGHLPGDLADKMAQFELPYEGICEEIFGKPGAYEKLKDAGKIQFMSSSILRGLTFNNSLIIVDECQSMTWNEIATIMTRVGKNSRIMFCGDMAQNDLVVKKNDVSGFRDFFTVTKSMPEFYHFKFGPADICRSGIVKSFILACEKVGV